jgi:nitrite reductase/ring-hydroxylating ferredoxin subunit/uncharacterized membrane protein
MSTAEPLDALIERIGTTEAIDGVAGPLSTAVSRVSRRGPLPSILSGTWLGHSLHPLLTDLPIGSWTSAFVLDVCGGRSSRRASQLLVGLGVVSAVPTAMTGLSDWADTTGSARRIGAVHAAINSAGLLCYGASWVLRKRGRHVAGVVAALVGATAATAAAHLGGHLVYRFGLGVDQNAFTTGPSQWEAAERKTSAGSTRAYLVAGGRGILASRHDRQWMGIDARCSHRGGPLQEGEVAHGCVTCPWHGSRFRLADGAVVDGPATAPQPRFDVREGNGTFEIRRAGAGTR